MGYTIAVSTFAGGILSPDLIDSMTPGRFRFIVCSAFLDNQLFRVVEYDALPAAPYAAVSYPWSGLEAPDAPPHSFFRLPLEGGQISDPISLGVLRTACLAARHDDTDLLWIDQICIRQTSAQDKDWQISNMFDLYDRCRMCLVLPGGLQRLASPGEETNWIERSWTLQEAMPASTHVIFSWELRCGRLSETLTTGYIQEIEKGRSAMMELGKLLQAAYVGPLGWRDQHVRVRLFGPNPEPILALMGAKEARVQEMREMAVWRSALLRTCSHPRDMILSIMGIFGVKLDASSYQRGDREKAAGDLAFEMLRSGRNASWLGAAPASPNLSSVCSMPTFPVVDGREVYYTVDGCKRKPWEVMGSNLVWYVEPLATTSMPERGAGRLHLTAKSLTVKVQDLKPDGKPAWGGFYFAASLILDEGPERGQTVKINLSASVAEGGYRAVVVGLVHHFCLPATAARAVRGAALLMLLTWNPSLGGWEIVAYGTIAEVEDVARTWPEGVHLIGS